MNYQKTTNEATNTRVLEIVLGFIGLALMSWVFTANSAFAATSRLDYARMNTAEVLMSAPEFSTVASVVAGTDLEAQLMSGEITTVFVPNNDSFAKIDPTTLNMLVADEMMLNQVLNLHWKEGRVYTGYFYGEDYFRPNSSAVIPVRMMGRDTYIGNAKLVMTDISTRDGIIHVIDEVIMPGKSMKKIAVPRAQAEYTPQKPRPMTQDAAEDIDEILEDSNDGVATMNLVGTLSQYDAFSTLVMLVKEAGLVDALSNEDMNITVFAPTNKAFEKLDPATLMSLKNNRVALLQVLLTHVLPEEVTEDDLNRFIDAEETLGMSFLRISRLNSPLVENARVIVPNLEATNGIIHALDAVIQIER